jgi:outer membrane protein TolC
MFKLSSVIVLVILIINISIAQPTILTEKNAIENALNLNQQIKISDLKIEKQTSLKGSAINLPNLEVLIQSPNGTSFRPGFMQGFDFPTVYAQQSKLQKSSIKVAESEKGITVNSLIYNVRVAYLELKYAQQKFFAYKNQDSTFAEIITMNDIRYRVGSISNLDKINGESYYKQIQFAKNQAFVEMLNAKMQLAILMGNPLDTSFKIDNQNQKLTDYDIKESVDTSFSQNPIRQYYLSQNEYFKRQLKVEKNKRIPGLMFGLLNQAEDNTALQYYFSAGVRLPIWYWAYTSRVKAAKKDAEIIQKQANYTTYTLLGEYNKELAMYRQYLKALEYYETSGLSQSAEILRTAKESYRLGSIGYYIYLQNINQAYQIQYAYLEALRNNNKAVVTLQYLKGDQKY